MVWFKIWVFSLSIQLLDLLKLTSGILEELWRRESMTTEKELLIGPTKEWSKIVKNYSSKFKAVYKSSEWSLKTLKNLLNFKSIFWRLKNNLKKDTKTNLTLSRTGLNICIKLSILLLKKIINLSTKPLKFYFLFPTKLKLKETESKKKELICKTKSAKWSISNTQISPHFSQTSHNWKNLP